MYMSASGEITKAMRLAVPRGMGAGRSGWHVFPSATELEPMLRSDGGPDNIIMTLVFQDGLHAAGMRRRLQARTELFSHWIMMMKGFAMTRQI